MDVSMMERLYLPVDGRQLTRQAKTILFLCQYCGWDFNVILVQTTSQRGPDDDMRQQETVVSKHRLANADKEDSENDQNARETNGTVGMSTCGAFKLVDGPSVGKPVERTSVGEPPFLEPPVGELTSRQPLTRKPFFGKSSLEEASIVKPPVDGHRLGEISAREPLLGVNCVGMDSVGEPSMEKPSNGVISVEDLSIGEASARQTLVGEPSARESLVGEPFIGDYSDGEPSNGKPPFEKPFIAEAPAGQGSIKHCECNNAEMNSNQNHSQQVRNTADRLAKISLEPWDALPVDMTVRDIQDRDWLVQQCCLPAIVGSGGQTCYAGLCAVMRRIVKKAQESHPESNFGALLGYKQACLKKCCEVSPWTKLCEIDIYQDLKVNGTIPRAIQEMEKLLESPLTVSSKVLGKKKRKEGTTPKTSLQESVMAESVFQTDSLHLTDKRKIKTAKSVYKKWANIKTKFERKLEQEHNAAVKKLQRSWIGCQDTMEPPLSEDAEESTSEDLSDQSGLTDGRNIVKQANIEIRTQIPKKQRLELIRPHPDRLFLEGPRITLADFALFYNFHSYQQKCMEAGRGRDLFRDIPLVCRWYQRMWTVPNVRDTAKRCGLEEVLISEDLEKSCTATKTWDKKVSEAEVDRSKEERTNKIKISQLPSVRNRVLDILSRLQAGGVDVTVEDLPKQNTQLPWEKFPEEINPSQDVSAERAMNKRHQIESVVSAVKMIAKPGDVIVDFCSGGGHVGIVLAHCLPDCRILLIENNEESVKRAEDRIQGTRLGNIVVYQCNVNYYTGMFDIGVSLHACGVATDLVLAKCLRSKASFVCSPCCYSSVRDSQHITYPRSHGLRDLPLSYEEYLFLGHVAEQTSRDFDSEMAKQAKICMSVLDTDRAQAAREDGYWVKLYTLNPPTCSPKNNLLIGRPACYEHQSEMVT